MNIAVVGRRGEGKSTLALDLAKKHAGKGVVIFDPRALYIGIRVTDSSELEDAIQERAWERGPICYTPDGDIKQAFQDLCDVLFPPRFTKSNFALIIDEAGQLQKAQASHPALFRAVAQHPLGRVTIIQTTHRLAELHTQLKALMDDLYIFCTVYSRDLDALLDYTESPEVVELVKYLPLHHCIHFSHRRTNGKQWRIIDDPAEWYSKLNLENDYAGNGRATETRESNGGSASASSGDASNRSAKSGNASRDDSKSWQPSTQPA